MVLDLLVLIIILIFGIKSYLSGFFRACFYFFPYLLSVLSTYLFQQPLSKMLRETFIYDNVFNVISNALKSLYESEALDEFILEKQTEFINGIGLPDFLNDKLIENNNNVVYEILDVSNLVDYVTAYLTNFSMNIIASIFIFIAVLIACKIIFTVLNLITKIPVINTVNKVFGFLIGAAQGTIIIWIIFMFLTFINFNTNPTWLYDTLEESFIAIYFYDGNILLEYLLKIFT